jgi:hypothetical protein
MPSTKDPTSPKAPSRRDLREFIYEANRNSYASSGSKKIKEKDGFTSIVYEKGDWKSHDNYIDSEPYGGRQVVFYKEKPVWIMVYYGSVDKKVKNMDKVYGFLMYALGNNSVKSPFRGPSKISKDGYEYTFKMTGNVEEFEGKEIIKINGKIVYSAIHIGGLVDIRK